MNHRTALSWAAGLLRPQLHAPSIRTIGGALFIYQVENLHQSPLMRLGGGFPQQKCDVTAANTPPTGATQPNP